MEVKAYRLSSFAKTAEGGNPAGVVLEGDGLSEKQMQEIASRVGYSETAFVSKSNCADFKVRFFTPNSEVDLCGHATIAVFSLMRQKRLIADGIYTQETKAGVLCIIIDETIYMQQTMPEFFDMLSAKELVQCLGISAGAFDEQLPVQIVSTGIKDILVPVRSMDVLEQLQPDMKAIELLSQKYDVCGLHVFTVHTDSSSTAACRNFAPLYGIPEESATGTSNGALACYLNQYNKLSADSDVFVFEQGNFMNMPSLIQVKLEKRGDELLKVWVGGKAVLFGEDIYNI